MAQNRRALLLYLALIYHQAPFWQNQMQNCLINLTTRATAAFDKQNKMIVSSTSVDPSISRELHEMPCTVKKHHYSPAKTEIF